jgi:PAS domain S-box-containing protein
VQSLPFGGTRQDGAASASDGALPDEVFFRATLDSLSAQVAVLDDHGAILAVNAAWTAFETDDGAEVGANYFEICERDGAVSVPPLREVLAGVRDEYVAECSSHALEDPRWFVVRASRFAGTGAPRLVLQFEDVTAHRDAEEEARFRGRLLDAVDAAVIALDPHGVVTAWNRGAERLYGWCGDEVLGRPAGAFLVGSARAAAGDTMSRLRARGSWEGEIEVQRKNGTRFPAYVRNAALTEPDGAISGYVGVSVDVTERQQAERDLRSARDYMRAVADSMGDGLCTLDECGRVVYLNRRAEEMLGWTTAELAGRDVHETLHHTGKDGEPLPPEACPLVAARLTRSSARVEDDVLTRRDGVLLPVRQVLTPFETEDGVGGFALVISDISERKRQANDSERKLNDLAWIERIRHAMDHDRFVLYAQPIVEIGSGRVVQHELLIRMLDEAGTAIPPGMFLPIAEEYGLIGEIDRWVVRQAMRLAADRHSVELNVSADSLGDPTFYDFVDAELRRSGADPALLVFELTETALLRNEAAALRFVDAIGRRGCGLALDDFGTGYGGFSYLKRLPVDYLKIDIEFVRDLTSEPASRKVVEAVVSLAQGFGIKTVAEGVEDDATLTMLQQLGVDYAQGYGIGRPAPLKDTIRAGEMCT